MMKLDVINEYLDSEQLKKLFVNKKKNDEVVEYANQIIEHVFTFTKPWDMERCDIPFALDERIDWNVIINHDEEWTFMLNRMSYLKDLVIASVITEDLKYGEVCRELILDWIESHQELKLEPSTRTLDTAIRIETIFEVCVQLDNMNILSENDKEIISESIIKQLIYLKDNYIPKYRLSNWGSIQVAVILSLCPFVFDEKSELEVWAEKELDEQLMIQINNNGMHWEQSTMYHAEVAIYLLKLIQYKKISRKVCDESLNNNVFKMIDALYQLTNPNGMIENYGDSDRTCAEDVFVKACVILDLNRWKNKEVVFDYDTMLLLGYNGIKSYCAMDKNSDFHLDCVDNEAGVYMFKNGDENNFSSTMFVNGSLGSGHGHCDNLHVSMAYQSEFILVDSGRFTYREDHPLRMYLKSMEAHNIVVIDNKPHSIPKGSWGMQEFCKPLKNYCYTNNELHYIEGGIVAPKQGFTQIRKLIIIDYGIWMIIDELSCLGKHSCSSYFHLDPLVSLLQEQQQLHIKVNDCAMRLYGDGEVSIETRLMSLNYNEITEHQCVILSNTFTDEGHLCTLILDESIQVEDVQLIQGDKIAKNDNLYTAKKFHVSEDVCYVVVVFHKEVYQGQKIFSFEGCSFHGQTIVIKEEQGIKSLVTVRH